MQTPVGTPIPVQGHLHIHGHCTIGSATVTVLLLRGDTVTQLFNWGLLTVQRSVVIMAAAGRRGAGPVAENLHLSLLQAGGGRKSASGME